MFFKKKCPICGAKNSKERMVCIECGAPLALGQVKGQLARVPTKGETKAKKEVEKAPKERAEAEYRDNEKVLYKTRGKLSLPHKKPQEADCLVTENHVVIEAEEPIKIPLSRIKDCRIAMAFPSEDYATRYEGPLLHTAELTFLDELNKKHKLSLQVALLDLRYFKQAIDKQMVGRFIHKVEEHPPNTTLGKFLFKIKETFRDKTRDRICAGLQRLGIDAQMAARGQVEEKVGGKGSLGIIHIPEGPIRWVNIRKETHGSGQTRSTYYYTDYGVLDPRLGPDSPRPRVRSVRVKTFPVFGQVVGVLWEGGDYGTGVISRLNSDHQLKHPIMMESRDVTITAIGDYSCWIISTQTRDTPSRELWNCYEAIARHLLAEWSPDSKAH